MEEVITLSYDDNVDIVENYSYGTTMSTTRRRRSTRCRNVGLVHTGFQSDLDSIYYKVIQEIQRQYVEAMETMNNTTDSATTTTTTNIRQPKLYITGHSKGGAIANLLAVRIATAAAAAAAALYDQTQGDKILDFKQKKKFILPKPDLVCTFASSRYCNQQFQEEYYNTILNISTVSYEGYLDIVPFLPPTIPGNVQSNDSSSNKRQKTSQSHQMYPKYY